MRFIKKPIGTSVKCALFFVGGVIIGAVPTFFITKKYYRAEEEEKLNAITKAYCDSLDDVYHGTSSNDSYEDNSYHKEPGYISSKIDDYIERAEGPKDISVRGDRDSINMRYDYSRISYDHPSEDNEDDNEEIGSVLDLNRERKVKTRKPRIIKEEEYGMIPGYEESELFFYKGDGILTGDRDTDIVDNPEELIGNALTKYGFFENDEQTIYVRNDSISTDYCITKINGSWENGDK